jgi:hypothetical protein
MSTHTCDKCNKTFKYKSLLTTRLNLKKSCVKTELTFSLQENTSEELPLDVCDKPWLYENRIYDKECIDKECIDTGKWMLFYDKQIMNDNWRLAKKLYREHKLDGVLCMKCSTNYENPRASTLDEGIIILYCSHSANEEKIINIGKNILELFDYKEKKFIYYKTDVQTSEGTNATGIWINNTYKLCNPLYKGKCLFNLNDL